MSKSIATIVPGPFAVVSSGNCTNSYMLDGDDIQARADAAMDSYWATTSQVIHRDIAGFGIQVEGSPYIAEVYTTQEAAERALASNQAA
ncbi:hypothetical protein AVMA1855_23330 [Acidovorax sp. SUPP1855]|uniref:hypothetical protein n=1 Tax=Acidovorax sp. SUPP1855 TaxID=431774 RepID=UPI0023DE5B3D|nr:hypothetical protein [Acidovorax sp. SUPP1855]GKS87140.1 hypothetical protein AVMA1855_23330 [Acidovorax sp. SUPP1855]